MPFHTDTSRAFLDDRRLYLADGGLETTLVFHEGIELPHFAACAIVEDDNARQVMHRYFGRFLAIAERRGTGFVLDTVTWRGGVHWGAALARSAEEMLRLNRVSAEFAKEIRDRWSGRVDSILINGVVGPAGDGYAPDNLLDADTAEAAHAPQIAALAESGIDLVSAITMTHAGEAAGIVRAAVAKGLPVVVSFTVETDGRLPEGQALGDAISEVDEITGEAPLYYMVNCAHPDHFAGKLEGTWTRRVGGVRANASRLSHAELDASETLDDGDPDEFGALHATFAARLPNLRMVGGCCGTDHRHVGCVAGHLVAKAAA